MGPFTAVPAWIAQDAMILLAALTTIIFIVRREAHPETFPMWLGPWWPKDGVTEWIISGVATAACIVIFTAFGGHAEIVWVQAIAAVTQVGVLLLTWSRKPAMASREAAARART